MDPERRRQQLLDVAALYVAEHGVDVSLDDIAQSAGVSPPLLRHYFKNRDGLLVALGECAIEEIIAIWTDPAAGSLADRLARYLEWIAVRPWAHRLWVAAPSKELPLAPLVERARRDLMSAAIGVGYEQQDTEQRVRSNAWVAVIESTIQQWVEDASAEPEGLRPLIRAGSRGFLRDYALSDLAMRLIDIAARLEIPGAREARAMSVTS